MFEFIADYKRRRAQGDQLRPVWQIICLLPLYLVYLPTKSFVRWMDNI